MESLVEYSQENEPTSPSTSTTDLFRGHREPLREKVSNNIASAIDCLKDAMVEKRNENWYFLQIIRCKMEKMDSKNLEKFKMEMLVKANEMVEKGEM